jgi:hypothetical protein
MLSLRLGRLEAKSVLIAVKLSLPTRSSVPVNDMVT